MDNELPNDFELVVIGTGMVESIIAAAASRIGKKVLHIDRNDYYGGAWASFNLEGIEKYIINHPEALKEPEENIKQLVHEGEHCLELGNKVCGVSNVSQQWNIPKEIINPIEEGTTETQDVTASETETESDKKEKCDGEKPVEQAESTEQKPKEEAIVPEINKDDLVWTQDKIMKQSRKFNLDIAPKLQFARGDFVELLISSNIARYSEYRSCSRVLTWLNGQLEIVPCSRSDVFSNTKVTVVEKRMLMKLLTTCMDSDEKQFADYENKKFINFLKDKKLTANLIHYVLYAISLSTDDTPCVEGITQTQRFLKSLGRFGKTPFLYSMYGSGELPQAFCRLCAVFGGTYCLNRPVNSLILNSENKCLSVICGTQRIDAHHFVIGGENIPNISMVNCEQEKISRAIFITDKSIMPSEKENLTLLLFPPEDGKNPITVIELGPATGTCPPGLNLVHMYSKQSGNPQNDLKHCVEKLLSTSDVENPSDTMPKILWSLYFTVTDSVQGSEESKLPSNIYICNGPDLDLDYDNAVRKAKDIFMKIYPESEFLPRAPDPEEIILCDEDTEKTDDLPIEKRNEEIPNETVQETSEEEQTK